MLSIVWLHNYSKLATKQSNWTTTNTWIFKKLQLQKVIINHVKNLQMYTRVINISAAQLLPKLHHLVRGNSEMRNLWLLLSMSSEKKHYRQQVFWWGKLLRWYRKWFLKPLKPLLIMSHWMEPNHQYPTCWQTLKHCRQILRQTRHQMVLSYL